MKTHYSIITQWSDEDCCYIASLPEFGPYALTHGETYEEALKNGKEGWSCSWVLPRHCHTRKLLNHPTQIHA